MDNRRLTRTERARSCRAQFAGRHAKCHREGQKQTAAGCPCGGGFPGIATGTAGRRSLPAPTLAVNLTEQRLNDRWSLVGNRQRLHPELLLGLQRLELGTFARHIRVNEVADP